VSRALAVLLLLGGAAGPAAAVEPTRIERVDAFIDAPYAVLGRTRAAIEARLGPPLRVGVHPLPRPAPAGPGEVHELVYPGLAIELRESGRIRRVQVTGPGFAWPAGLAVGASRDAVLAFLGEPQEVSETAVLYLYSDAYPDTVTFHFRDHRVHRIEWRYWVAP
jgi:hypothetical protein